MAKHWQLVQNPDDNEKSTDYANRPELHGIVSEKNFNLVKTVNQMTKDHLGDEWIANIQKNKKYWRKGSKMRDMMGLGRNKATVGIGAGPSFKKNRDILIRTLKADQCKPWPDREFIIMSSNHQFKPIMEMGVIPDFVILVDAADTVHDQLNKDIPEVARNTQLITGAHVSPRILKNWTKQGRHVIFYTTPADFLQEAGKKYGLSRFAENKLEMGGNVLNASFMVGCAVLQSTVFMGVGNDLSFEVKDSLDEQRASYYADGDYSSNAEGTGSGRDEGKSPKRWAGYRMEKRRVIRLDEPIGCKARYNFELDVVGTSHTLWVYKTWMETIMLGQLDLPVHLHYFNCSEGGILGVMAKNDEDQEEMRKADNWYFLDEVAINRHTGKQMYMTAMLEDAIEIYLRARRSQKSWDYRPEVRYGDGQDIREHKYYG